MGNPKLLAGRSLVFCENKNIQVLKQALEEELGFAAPQLYRQQVAELAKLIARGTRESSTLSRRPQMRLRAQRNRLFENVDGIRFLLHEGGAAEPAKIPTICAA